MTTITARTPEVDWDRGFDRHWYGGNAAVTHTFNTLSLLFPQGERFFIDTARQVASGMALPPESGLGRAVRGFTAQETVHARLHERYNAVLLSQGFENVVSGLVARLQAYAQRNVSPLTRLAIVCAYEHYTDILGNYVLSNPAVLRPARADMALVWGWHSAEETEHKSVCFDLYEAAGGGWPRRIAMLLRVTVVFSLVSGRQYLSLLSRDGCLKPSRILKTAGQSLRFFLGPAGVGWHMLFHGLRYLGPRFHPWNQDNRPKLEAWLATHRSSLGDIAERRP